MEQITTSLMNSKQNAYTSSLQNIFLFNSIMTLTILLEKQTKSVRVATVVIFHQSHSLCLDPINAGRDETARWSEMEKTFWWLRLKKMKLLVPNIHCATNIKVSKVLEEHCLWILGCLSDRLYEKTAVTFTAQCLEYSQGKKQFLHLFFFFYLSENNDANDENYS